MRELLPALSSAVVIMTPLLLAAAGGLFTELSGRLNIALEGLMLTGAFFAILAAHYTGSLFAALALAALASTALSALLAFTSLKLRSNLFIAGLAANLLAGGLAVVLSQRFFGTRGVVVLRDFARAPVIRVPLLERVPVLGELLSGNSVFVYAGLALLALSWLALYKTPFGYRLRACSGSEEALVSLGVRPDLYRWAAFLISGFLCGISGAFLSLHIGVFVPGMTAGRGWMALVVIFLGLRRPAGILAAAFALGLAEALSNFAQGFDAPADFALALPYFLTLVAMILVSIWDKRRNGVR